MITKRVRFVKLKGVVALEKEQSMVLTVQELAETLGISEAGAYALCRREGFPAVRVTARRIVIPVRELEAWLSENRGV